MSNFKFVATVPPEFAALGITEGESVVIPRSQYEALMAVKEALEQCVDDFGEAGRCVCQQAKQEAIEALASLRSAGIEIEDKT